MLLLPWRLSPSHTYQLLDHPTLLCPHAAGTPTKGVGTPTRGRNSARVSAEPSPVVEPAPAADRGRSPPPPRKPKPGTGPAGESKAAPLGHLGSPLAASGPPPGSPAAAASSPANVAMAFLSPTRPAAPGRCVVS
jgi:hypothetical protein